MHMSLVKLNTIAVSASWLGLLACSSSNAQATDNSIQIGHFSVPGAAQGWPYVAPTVAPAQIFMPNTTSDTTHPINWLNPASVAGAGFNPNTLTPMSTIGSSFPYTVPSTPYIGSYGGGWGGAYRSGIPFMGTGFSPLSRVPFLGGGIGIPFVGSIPYVGSIGSFGLPFIGRSFGGFGGGWGSSGWSGIGSSFIPYGGFGGFGGFGGLGGYGGFANPAAFMGSFGGGAHQGPVGNRVIQTGPSPSSGNYYQPATADPSASGGYYASGPTAAAPPAAPPTKNQPKSYYDSYGSDNNWGASGSPLPKDLNSVPWAK